MHPQLHHLAEVCALRVLLVRIAFICFCKHFFSLSLSFSGYFLLCRSITPAPSWVRGTWTLRGLRRASPPTSSVSQRSGRGVKETSISYKDGDSYVFSLLSIRGLHSHQEPRSFDGEECRSQSGESYMLPTVTNCLLSCRSVLLHRSYIVIIVFKTFMNSSV